MTITTAHGLVKLATIYARFPGKEALFTAVVMQSVAANTARVETLTPTGATIEERLESVAVAALQRILASPTSRFYETNPNCGNGGYRRLRFSSPATRVRP
jgi:AcrR family transcriptional regulator